MKRPSVSVIVPTFNRIRYLPSAIASLVAQTHPFDELLIVDDGSKDNTAEVVASLPGKPTYLRKDNGGRASAINHGVGHAKGDLIWVFDDDDVALPDALAKLIAPFLEREVDFTYSPWYLCNELPDGSLEVDGTSGGPKVGGHAFFHEMLFRCFTQGNAMLIAKRCYDAVGPMREDLIRSQDHDYMLRLGRRFHAVPLAEPTFYWRRHMGPRGAGNGNMFAVEKIVRNWHLYRQKIFVDLHGTLPLMEYLPLERQALFPGNTREARLTRCVVMACHGLWSLSFAELLEVAETADQAPLNAAEQAALERLSAFVTSDALQDLATAPESALMARIDRSPIGRIYIQQLLRAGRWQVHNHWRDGERADALRVGRSLVGAIGLLRTAVRGTEHLMQGRTKS
jgi:glycosyltransferase involved in cell wall biosynthesis